MKKIFTPREIAELLHVAPTTIYAELERGRLPHTRIGRKYIITRRQLEDYLTKEVVEELLGEKEGIPHGSTLLPRICPGRLPPLKRVCRNPSFRNG